MIFWPPGHAKSTYSSHYGPAWLIGRKPDRNVIHASHTIDLAERFGRKIRNTLASPDCEDVFGSLIADDSRAAARWETKRGGEYYATGIGGAITGRRAGLGLIDDPVKSRQQADSPTYRQTAWNWYTDDFRTRLYEWAAILLIQTRWHEDDLAGRILPADYDFRSGWVTARDGEEWYVLNFPAICERADDLSGRAVGEALWPGWYSLEYLEQQRRSLGSRSFDALYQQRPRPGEGGVFKESWLRDRYREIPAGADVFIHSWDTAQKPEQINDPTVGTFWRMGRGVNRHYLAGIFRDRIDYPTLRRMVVSAAERDRPAAVLIEDKSSGASLIQDLRASTTIPVIPIEPIGDKTFRATEVSAMVEAGLMALPESAPWLVDFESEFFGFPLSTNDDQVDSVSQYLKWVRGFTGRIESAGAGARTLPASGLQSVRVNDDEGFGSVSRLSDGEG